MSFVRPDNSGGPDSVIPPDLIANARGLAILTVIKAGFLWSGRIGSGIVVARLSDGSKPVLWDGLKVDSLSLERSERNSNRRCWIWTSNWRRNDQLRYYS